MFLSIKAILRMTNLVVFSWIDRRRWLIWLHRTAYSFCGGRCFIILLCQKRIGYGNVYKIKDKKAARYICKNAKGLSIILSIINDKLVSIYKYNQLVRHNYGENFNVIMLPSLKSLSLDNY